MFQLGAALEQAALNVLVERDVGAAEAIDRLLGVAHDKQFAGEWAHAMPIGLGAIGGGEQQQDFRLQRIGILELVDEDMADALLQLGTHGGAVAHEIARDQQQVDEVEHPGALLGVFVVADDRPQLVAQKRREVGAGGVAKARKPCVQRAAPRHHLGARERREILAPSLPSPAPVVAAQQRQQRGLQRVVVAPAHGLQARRFVDRTRDLGERLAQPILRIDALGERAERADLFDQRIDLRIAIERLMAPRRVEVAPLQKLPRRGADDRPRTFAVETLTPAQETAQALARRSERLLEPSIEGAFEQFAGHVVGCDLEHRIDARIDRPLAQEIGAKRMDRADTRLLELAERTGEPLAFAGGARGVAARALDLGAQPQLELAGGLLGERHRHDSAKLGAPARQRRDDPVDQCGGFAGAGRGLDDERGVEVVADTIAHALIGDLLRRDRFCLCRFVISSSASFSEIFSLRSSQPAQSLERGQARGRL